MAEDIIYLTKDFEPVEADDPRMAMVKVRYPDGRIVFGFPAEEEEEAEPEAEAPVQNKLFIQGGPGSGNFDHSGRPGKVGGSGKGEGSSMTAKEASNISLPPDDSKYEYFYHATRYDSNWDAIRKEGVQGKGNTGIVYLSKDEIRDLNSGFAIVRVPKGVATEGVDVVDASLRYRQWTVDKIPTKDIVRIVPVVTDNTGYRIREDELASYALTGKATEQEISDLPKEYQHWFRNK